jgi:acyl dehydratase
MAKRPFIENRTFDEISIGDEANLSRTLAWRDIELFAAMSGDVNRTHVDAEFAKNDMFHRIMPMACTLISTVLGTELPGRGTTYLSQSLEFRHPIGLGDTVTVGVRADREDLPRARRTPSRASLRCQRQSLSRLWHGRGAPMTIGLLTAESQNC